MQIADEMFALLGTGRLTSPVTSRFPEFDLKAAYEVAATLRALREARGERVVGRKAGFTNSSIWERFNMTAPIWGYIYDTTLHDLDSISALPLGQFSEPRIEPEIIFGFKAAPQPDMSAEQIVEAIEWVSLGYEIVQSVFPGWTFRPPDTVAAFGLHAALLIGEKHRVSGDPSVWVGALASFEVDLRCDGEVVQRGGGAKVLGSPISVVSHLVRVLADQPEFPPIGAGDVLTTGTLTDPYPVVAGQRWTTIANGIALGSPAITFA